MSFEIATGSLFEVVSQSTISKRRGFLTEEKYRAIYSAAEEQSRMLSALRASVLGYMREDDAPALNSQLSTLNNPPL